MKKLFLSLCGFLALPAIAQTFEFEGVVYDVYDAGFRTCITGAGADTVNLVDGDLEIPEIVMYNGEEYTVIGIGQYSFFYADEYFQQPWTLTLPNTILFINDGAFWHCEYLTDVKLSDALGTINYSAFSHCYSLGNVHFPESLTYVGDWAFYANYSMTEVILPPNLTATGIYAFCGPRGDSPSTPDAYLYGNVEKVYVPSGFDELNQRAFGYQDKLKAVYCYATTPPVLTSAPFNHSSTEEATLFVPSGSEGDYRSDVTWSNWEWMAVEAITEEYPWTPLPDEPEDPQNPDEGGVEMTFAGAEKVVVYDLNGRVVDSRELNPGIYIIREGKRTIKRVIR